MIYITGKIILILIWPFNIYIFRIICRIVYLTPKLLEFMFPGQYTPVKGLIPPLVLANSPTFEGPEGGILFPFPSPNFYQIPLSHGTNPIVAMPVLLKS